MYLCMCLLNSQKQIIKYARSDMETNKDMQTNKDKDKTRQHTHQ